MLWIHSFSVITFYNLNFVILYSGCQMYFSVISEKNPVHVRRNQCLWDENEGPLRWTRKNMKNNLLQSVLKVALPLKKEKPFHIFSFIL